MIECCCCSDTGHDRAGCGAADSLRSAARRLLAAWASVVRSPPHSPFARGSSSNLPLHCGHRGHDVHRDGMVNLDRAHCVIQCVPSEHTASPCPPPLHRTSSHPPSARATLAPPQHASTLGHAHTRTHTIESDRRADDLALGAGTPSAGLCDQAQARGHRHKLGQEALPQHSRFQEEF